MDKSAILSRCGKYRYVLTRSWDSAPKEGSVVWIMLNPSTADAKQDDPTIRRCVNFTKRLGYGKLIVVNLFALRATDPRQLAEHDDPSGPENKHYLHEATASMDLKIAAWGVVPEKVRHISKWTINYIRDRGLACLGKTKEEFPKHPLYLPSDSPLAPWP